MQPNAGVSARWPLISSGMNARHTLTAQVLHAKLCACSLTHMHAPAPPNVNERMLRRAHARAHIVAR